MTDEIINHDKTKLEQFLKVLLDVQTKLNVSCYFVGGCVRDRLLKQVTNDYDIAVDGDLEQMIQALKETNWGANEGANEDANKGIFELTPSILGTAKVRFGKYHVDLATFRSERYTSNNGLPEIAAGDIESDLSRRDFTINTGYILLSHDNLDKMLHVDDAIDIEIAFAHPKFHADIENGVLRVLHDRSFIEDPSRMLRAVKYSTLYDLKMDDATQSLFNTASKKRLITDYSRDRYRQIVLGYAKHKHGIEILTNIYKQSLLLQVEVSEPSNTKRIQAYYDLFAEEPTAAPAAAQDHTMNRGILYLLLIYEYHLAFWFGADRQISEIAKSCIALQETASIMTPVQCQSRWWGYETFKRYDACSLIFAKDAVSISETMKHALHTYLEETQFIKLSINGNTLKNLGIESGKKIGLLLNLLLAHKVDTGSPMTQEEEIKWIESKQYEY